MKHIPLCKGSVVSHSDFELRCPSGKKTRLYQRAKLEKFAHYLMKDGLVRRLSVYDDRESKCFLLSIFALSWKKAKLRHTVRPETLLMHCKGFSEASERAVSLSPLPLNVQ